MANLDTTVRREGRRLALPARLGTLGQTYGALGALIVLVLYNVFFTRNFLTTQTLNVNLTQVATIVIVAVGMTLVIATGGIDLSVGSLMAISGAIAPMIFLGQLFPLPNLYVGVGLAFVIPVLISGLFGLFNGWM